MKTPERKQWTWHELVDTRDNDSKFYDFDNTFSIHALNPSDELLLQIFTVTRRTNDILQDAPLWFPGRDIQQEIAKLNEESKAKRFQLRSKLSTPPSVCKETGGEG